MTTLITDMTIWNVICSPGSSIDKGTANIPKMKVHFRYVTHATSCLHACVAEQWGERRERFGEDERVGPERREVVQQKRPRVGHLEPFPAEDAAQLADLERAVRQGRFGDA